jgi:lipopolysaccharide transport system ATP-binding protein
MSEDIVIKAEHVSKEYRLGVINHGTLYRDLQSWWARYRARTDPNVEIKELATQRRDQARIKGDLFRALDDVSFEVQRGDIVGIIGRNGAGKSTLLKVISRITAPTSGYIGLKGRIASLLEVGTGFHPELTGRENVFLNGAILGMSKAEVTKKFEQIVEFSEIGQFIDTPVKRYSSGMYVRLAFSVAAHLDSDILLVDEVLAVGDFNFQKKCMECMQGIGKDGRTIIFVSHNMTAINSLCSRAIWINDGKLAGDGKPSQMVQNYLANGAINLNGTYSINSEIMQGKAVIYKICVLNKNDENVGLVELTECFSVQICYEIREPMAGLIIGLQIISEDGYTAILSLSDPELVPERLSERKPGRYKSVVKFPPTILNTGLLSIRVGISTRYQIYAVVEGIQFEVIDSIGIVQFMGWPRKNAISSLQLPWEIEIDD